MRSDLLLTFLSTALVPLAATSIAAQQVRSDDARVPSRAVARERVATSPRIAALAARLRAGDTAAVRQFWEEVAERRTPLLEMIDGDTTEMLATFVLRDTVGWRNVVLFQGVAGWAEALTRMDHLAGTDIWHKTVRVPQRIRISYQFRPDDDLTPWWARADYVTWARGLLTDPLNPVADTAQGRRSVLVGPRADPQPLVARRPDVRAGRVDTSVFESARLGNRRRLFVYTPPDLDAAAARRAGGLPLVVLFDGDVYAGPVVPTPTILDNLRAEERIGPVIGVFVGNAIGVPNARMRELACDDAFGRALVDEILPWVRERYSATRDARRTVVGGSSHGGLMALCAAIRFPGVFGNVLAQSASAWWSPEDDPEFEWVSRTLSTRERLPVRFYVEVGRYETQYSARGGPGQVTPNRHLRDVLRAKGYDVTYREFPGAHEYFNWRGTLGPALELLLRPPAR